MKLSDAKTGNFNTNQFFSDSKIYDREKSEPDVFNPAPLNHIMENIKDFYYSWIKSQHTRIVKYNIMTPTAQKLEEIYASF